MQRDQILALILDCVIQGRATELAILSEAQAWGVAPDDINDYMDACIKWGWIYALEPASSRDRASYGITAKGRRSRSALPPPGHEPEQSPETEYWAAKGQLIEIHNGTRLDYFFGGAQ